MDDRALFLAWAAGDRKAGMAFFDAHYERILRFFHNKVEDGSAPDLVQSTFLGSLEAKDRFRGDASVRTFLFAIAHNVLHKHYRTRRRRPFDVVAGSTEGAEGESEECAADVFPSASTMLRAKEEQRLVLEALRRIPLDCQVVLELHYWEHMDTAEIAEIVGIPVGTVKSRLQRGRRTLEEKLSALATSRELLESTVTRLDDWARGLRDRTVASSS